MTPSHDEAPDVRQHAEGQTKSTIASAVDSVPRRALRVGGAA